MNQQDYESALAKLQAAITDPAGELRPITRIELELLDGNLVRWNIWQDSSRLYSATGQADDVAGFLAASRMILEMRAGVPIADTEKGGAP